MPLDWQEFYSASARVMTRSLIRELLKLTRRGGILSFAGGLPDPATFPVDEIKAIATRLLDREANLVLQYGPTEGDARLRDELVKWMAKDGIHASRDQVLVTLGSQQGLDLVGRVFLDPGDQVIVELPTYMAALQVFRSYRVEMLGVPQDGSGMRMDLLEETLARLARDGRRPKFIYVGPDFQNPSGATMSEDRRTRLLDLAQQDRTLVVEDNPYRELCFEGAPPPPLAALSREMPPGVTWTHPHGGLFLWVRLPEGMDTERMLPPAVEEGVAYVVGSGFHADGGGRNAMRLNFSFPSEAEIEEGVRRLARLVKKNLPAAVRAK